MEEISGPESLAIEDLNGDGLLDIVADKVISGNVSVLLGNGDGTFAEYVTYATGDFPRSLTLKDLNGDSFLDVVTANGYPSHKVSVLLGNGDGTFVNQVT